VSHPTQGYSQDAVGEEKQVNREERKKIKNDKKDKEWEEKKNILTCLISHLLRLVKLSGSERCFTATIIAVFHVCLYVFIRSKNIEVQLNKSFPTLNLSIQNFPQNQDFRRAMVYVL